MKARVLSGITHKLYINGDIWKGETFVGTIADSDVLDYLMERRWTFPSSKIFLDKLLSNGEDFIRDKMESEKR